MSPGTDSTALARYRESVVGVTGALAAVTVVLGAWALVTGLDTFVDVAHSLRRFFHVR
jgi:hypothetical protein